MCFPCVHTDMNMNLQFQAICPQPVSYAWKMEPRFSDQQKIHQVVKLILFFFSEFVTEHILLRAFE